MLNCLHEHNNNVFVIEFLVLLSYLERELDLFLLGDFEVLDAFVADIVIIEVICPIDRSEVVAVGLLHIATINLWEQF